MIARALQRVRSALGRRIGVITDVATTAPVAALTFDDGPHPEWTPRLLDLLDRHQAKATFFMVGEMAARHPELVNRIAGAGHAIGNHSWNHPSFPAIRWAERSRQIARCEDTIRVCNAKLFRPPFGDLNWSSFVQLTLGGFRVIGWNVSSADWEKRDPASIVAEVEGRLKPGSIVLMHDHLFAYSAADEPSRNPMLTALDELLERAPFSFVTVPELLCSGRPRRRFWLKETEGVWLRGLQSFGDLGFKY